MAPHEPFHRERRLAVAVSGGADSMAMAWLLARWGRPAAFIVDHGLRAESRAEAVTAVARLARFGVKARVLSLQGLGHGAAAARRARYAALFAACAADGFSDLLVGHHAADQAETVQLRAAAGSGAAGLAGMAAVTVRGPVRIVRPLLRVPPGRLRATLRLAGVSWSEDPGNTDPATPRGHLRADPKRLVARAPNAGAERALAERAVASELAQSVSVFPDGVALVQGTLSMAALSALLWTVSGRAHPPRPYAVARMVPLRQGTLHGVIISDAGRHGPGWLLWREPAAVSVPVPAIAGAVWDGRFRLALAVPGGCLGARSDARSGTSSVWPARVRQSLPAVRPEPANRPDLLFDPARPMAPAPFVPS